MTNITERQIDVLNGLISATLDSADGYGEAANDARNPLFKSLFKARASERRQMTADLRAVVRSLGREPKDDRSILAVGHRLLLTLKNVVTHSDASVIKEVESGEDAIKGLYEAALQDVSLATPVRAMVAKACERVKADHSAIRDLKHELQARNHSGVDSSI